MDRRRFLAALTAATAGLAGCSGSGDGGSTPTVQSTPTPTATAEPTPTATDADTEPPTDTPTPTPEPTPTAATDPDVTVGVGRDGLNFVPQEFTVPAGGTVLWVWVGNGHNVKPRSGGLPDGADWSGTPGPNTRTFGEGYRYSHTFEVAGEYEYRCVPHGSVGMVGSFTVG
jgi:plastocyanin